MKGTRPLDNNEIRFVSACFTGTFEVRNRGLFMLGVSTGGRISELLSLTIGDVYQNRRAVTDLLYDRSIVKGGEVSRAVPVNTDGLRAIDDLVRWHREQYRTVKASRPLFPSRNGKGKQRMTRRAAHYEKIQENRQAKIEKAIATGESKVINALTNLAEASKGEITVEKAIEQYKAQNGNTDSGNTPVLHKRFMSFSTN